MPTTRSSPMRRMPFTPLELRPMGRASDSLKRMAMPRAVESTSSSPGLVTTTSTSSSPSRSLMAMMPLFMRPAVGLQRGLLHQPAAVAMTRKWSGASKSRTARQSVICSPSARFSRLTMARPRLSRANCGRS